MGCRFGVGKRQTAMLLDSCFRGSSRRAEVFTVRNRPSVTQKFRISPLRLPGALWTLALASVGALGCDRFTTPAETNRPPFLRAQLVVPSGFPTDRVGFAELILTAAGDVPLPLSANRSNLENFNGVPVIVRVEPEPANPERRRVVVSFGQNPFRGAQRTVDLFLYPFFGTGDGGVTPPMRLEARLLTPQNQLIARGDTTTDEQGSPILMGDRDRTAQVVVACVPGGPCGEPIIPGTARITVTRAPDCPRDATLSGKLYAILFPTGPNAGQGQLFGFTDNVDFTAGDARHTVVIANAPPGSYLLLAVLDVGGDLPVGNLSPQRGDLSSATPPFDILAGRVAETTIALDTVVDIGACASVRNTPPPTLFSSTPRSPGLSLNPTVEGVSPVSGTLTVHDSANCAGAPLATVAVTASARFTAAVTVAANTTTTLFAKVDGPTPAPCSTVGFSYAHDAVAPTLAADAFALTPAPSGDLGVLFAAGADNITPAERLQYEACVDDRPKAEGGCTPFRVAGADQRGVAQTLSGFTPGARVFVVGRARDEAGNASAEVEKTAYLLSPAGVKSVVLGAAHTCALLGTGEAACFGANTRGQLGATPALDAASGLRLARPALPIGVRQLVNGANHTCALDASGAVFCWGANDAGQVGDGTIADRAAPVQVELPMPGAAVEIAAGRAHTCALLADGRMACWGSNNRGQLSNEVAGNSLTATLAVGVTMPVAPFDGIRRVAAAGDNTCIIGQSDGGNDAAICVGSNATFQIPGAGFSTADQRFLDGNGSAWTGTAQLAMGTGFTAVRETSGGIANFGDNSEGQLGINSTTSDNSAHSPSFGNRTSISRFVAAGTRTSCSIGERGALDCWGANDRGQVGDGTTTRRLVPTDVLGVNEPVASVATSGEHTCAVLASGALSCWGRNDARQTSASAADVLTPTVVRLQSPPRGVQLATGARHACVRLSNASVSCWGDNTSGQLGDGSRQSRARPGLVAGLPATDGVLSVSAGQDSTCVVTVGGRTRCFGAGERGQLGDGTKVSSVLPGFAAPPDSRTNEGLPRASSVSVGAAFACAATARGTGFCWGAGEFGQTTQSDLEDSSAALGLRSAGGGLLFDVLQVSAGGRHACARQSRGGVLCWGDNTAGQLANPQILPNTTIPVQILMLGAAEDISAGGVHTCVVSTSGGLECWGANAQAQLGVGDVLPRTNAIVAPMGTLPPMRKVAAGRTHTCALTAAGRVYCWGSNDEGQCGQPASARPVLTPTAVGSASTVRAIDLAAGDHFTCLLGADGLPYCWGRNAEGQLGARSGDTSSPAVVAGFP